MRQFSCILLAISGLVVALAAAPAHAADNDPAAPMSLPTVRDVVVDVGPDEANLVPVEKYLRHGSKILFVNRCTGGETITRGFNDSRTNRSSIVSRTTTFPAYPYGDASWNQVMSELRDILAPYNIDVTDVDPGSSIEHFEIIACGTSFRGENVLGVAPSGCGVVENAIGYAFAEEHGDNPRYLAETIAHEAAHTWTMPHLYDCEDPMTYLNGCGDKYFQDLDLSCAEVSGNQWVRSSCGCGGSTRNSHQVLLSIFGPGTPTPPTVSIVEPLDGATVAPGFVVRPEITDDQGVASASLYIDGALVMTLEQGPFVFNAPAELANGSHMVEVRAADRQGSVGTASITVLNGGPCACADGESCIDGRCVPGQGQPGGLGGACTDGAECASGLCASAGDQQLCTEPCESSCPSGFACVPGGGGNVCWPSESGGICSTGGDPGDLAPILLGLLFVLVGGRRLRR